MYFPIGWPKQLKVLQDDSLLVCVACNSNRNLFSILTEKAISIWFSRPSVQIVSFCRSENSLSKFGSNQQALWKPDSTSVAVTTTKGYIIFYKVSEDTRKHPAHVYVQKEERRSGNKREVVDVGDNAHIPALLLEQTAAIQIQGSITGLDICLREELMVATGHGQLVRLRWDGLILSEMTIDIHSIPFSVDLQHSRASQLSEPAVYVLDVQFSPLLTGFAVVLSNGKGAFIAANSLKLEPSQMFGVWAQDANDVTTVAINHKYSLIAYGCKNGEAIVYQPDDLTGALAISHKLVVSSKDFPEASLVCGGVKCMQWTPDGSALVMAWEKGGFSLWSVFGALLLHSMGVEAGGSFSDEIGKYPLLRLKSMAWCCEGYSLWLVSERPLEGTNGDTTSSSYREPHLLQLHFVKSALTVNPCMSNHKHLLLQGEDKLYLSSEKSVPQWTNNGGSDNNQSVYMGSKQWHIKPLPHTYLVHNWPIRYAAVDPSGQYLAVAGKTGLAHTALLSRKWKLFGNETQEKHMVVTGGLTWWNEFICMACYNMLDQRDEIRCYPRNTKLDNSFCHTVRVPSPVMLLNTFKNILIVLCADCHIMMFKLEDTGTYQKPQVNLSKIQEVAIGNFIAHPATVVAITLTTIRTETASLKGMPSTEAESIIVNIAGKLLMFQRDRSGQQPKPKDNSKFKPVPFCAPVMVASSVENMWYCPQRNEKKRQLTEALWLGCGALGMKVWLPLTPKDEGIKHKGFMSTRIMLPFHVDLYPLAVMFEAGIILGATSESLSYQHMSDMEEGWPYLQLQRTNQVYLHQILRQLLRRNLGNHSLDIAGSCTDLPYFHHVLELLLHEVLEEEATSKEPIPDPLLPRIVAFVQEFPEFLQTVVHCARKTEVALWQYLFATIGNPKDLFEECLSNKELTTAASYLIILQNLEKPQVARQHATMLLDASLDNCKWELARDLVRFLRAIDPSDAESPLQVPRSRISTSSVYPATYPSPPMSPNDSPAFMYPAPVRPRNLSKDSDKAEKVPARSDSASKIKLAKSDSQTSIGKTKVTNNKEDSSAEQFFIDVILNRHARKLLSAYRLRDLACFAANLEDYLLVAWLRKERIRAARVEDFISALKRLHEDFTWPIPIMSLADLKKIASSSSLCSLEVDVSTGVDGTKPKKQNNIGSPQNTQGSSNSSMSTADVLLQPQIGSEDGLSMSATTEISDSSSMVGDGDDDAYTFQALEHLSHELANKGPPQSELELRYLNQMLLEAGCLEWALLIAVILRDSMAVVRAVNAAAKDDTPIEIVGRMREGLSFLDRWADAECIGYKPFLQAIQRHTSQLQKIAEQDPPTSRMATQNMVAPRSKRLSETSTMSSDSVDTLGQSQSHASEQELSDLPERLESDLKVEGEEVESQEDAAGGCILA